MKKIFVMILSLLMIFSVTGCGGNEGGNEKKSAETQTQTESAKNKILVAYFSCTGNTKTLAENSAEVLKADLYEIKPKIPYTSEDLNWNDETTRATVEQRTEKARPELADKDAKIENYDTIIIAYPIWWHVAPRIIDTFMESYDFSGKKVMAISTSGGSDITASVDELKAISGKNITWLDGKCFFNSFSKSDVKTFFDGVELK